MAEIKPNRKPAFFWQGVLILLPVGVLSVICLFSLRQDKSFAEQDARNLGGAVAAQIAGAIGREAAHQLTNYFLATESEALPVDFDSPPDLNKLERETRVEAIQHPESDIDTSQVVKNTEESWHAAEKWQKNHRAIDLSTVPAVTLTLANSETVLVAKYRSLSSESDLYSDPPLPPNWVQRLSAEQTLIWTEERSAEASGDVEVAQQYIERFLATSPSWEARANAGFHQLLLKTRNMPASEAEKAWTESPLSGSQELTDAGVPIEQLVLYRALRLLPDNAGISDYVFAHVAFAAWCCPSILCEPLVAETIRVVGTRPEYSQRVVALQWCWRSHRKALGILKAFTEQHPGITWSNGFVWAESPSGNFLISLHKTGPEATDHGLGFYEIAIFPEAVVFDALQHALQAAEGALPLYAVAEVELAGKKFRLAGQNTLVKSNTNSLSVLGESFGEVAMPPQSLFSQPIQVRVLLADRDLLYAHQRQRTMAFAAVILTSTIAALAGLIAARRAFYRQLQLNEMKSNFVSSVSHELRAPIASVRLMAENLESGRIPEAPRQREYFHFIVEECRRLSSLIENALDFSRIEQGRRQYEFESTDVAGLAQTTVKLMAPRAAEKKVRLELIGAEQQIELNVDGRAIQQALVNLIDNAIKHSPKGESVMVTIETEGATDNCASGRARLRPSRVEPEGMARREPRPTGTSAEDILCLSVADRGPGIPPEEHEKIFERFYRLGSELRRETEGVGIGLSIVKHIITAHGGRVVLRSEPGKGSTFTIELPGRRHNE